MTVSSDRLTVLVCLLLLSAAGPACSGSDGEDDEPSDPTTPLELSSDNLGVGFHHGEAGVLPDRDQQAIVDTAKSTFSHAFLHVQAYDEHSWEFGEWEVYPPQNRQGSDYRDFDAFKTNQRLGRLEPRSADLVDEVQGTFGEQGFEQTGLVIDFWRMRGDWYVRWNGKLDEMVNLYGEGDYGFFRSEMVNALLDDIEAVAEDEQLDYIIIGTEMERLLATDEGEGIAPDDFSNFKRFYRKAAARIQSVAPKTKVGSGFNWDRFARRVAPAYGEVEEGEIPGDATLARAFETVILPFVEAGDILALKSYRKPEGEAGYYSFLASRNRRFDLGGTPLIWYSIGSPVDNASADRKQRTYLKEFVAWNKGLEPEIVAWNSLLNIDRTDGADKKNCEKMVESKKFQLDEQHCYDGLVDTLFERKDVYEYLIDQIE